MQPVGEIPSFSDPPSNLDFKIWKLLAQIRLRLRSSPSTPCYVLLLQTPWFMFSIVDCINAIGKSWPCISGWKIIDEENPWVSLRILSQLELSKIRRVPISPITPQLLSVAFLVSLMYWSVFSIADYITELKLTKHRWPWVGNSEVASWTDLGQNFQVLLKHSFNRIAKTNQTYKWCLHPIRRWLYTYLDMACS